jgi:hypothetical protein
MQPHKVIADIRQNDGVERPAFVLVSNGTVVAHFGPDEAVAAADTAYRMTERDGHHIDVYEVDRRLPLPPPVGTPVDPLALGWVDVN